jgi:hypothetical protein
MSMKPPFNESDEALYDALCDALSEHSETVSIPKMLLILSKIVSAFISTVPSKEKRETLVVVFAKELYDTSVDYSEVRH